MSRSTTKIRAAAAVVVLTVVAAGCGGNDARSTNADNDQETSQAGRPERIVSLSPTATEILFAIGAGEQVVAVDDQSDFPADVPKTDLSGFQPNIEAIADFEPDLVVISGDTGDLKSGLEALGATVLLQPPGATLEDTYTQIEELGEATGHEDGAAELVDEMKAEIQDLIADLPATAQGMTYYHELDPTFFSVTSDTFIGSVYALMGLENIADTVPDPAGGYPQLSEEFIIAADPDLIFLADTICCQQSAESVAARPGWADLAAVKRGGVIELDDSVASRWGPRVVDFVRLVAKKLAELES